MMNNPPYTLLSVFIGSGFFFDAIISLAFGESTLKLIGTVALAAGTTYLFHRTTK